MQKKLFWKLSNFVYDILVGSLFFLQDDCSMFYGASSSAKSLFEAGVVYSLMSQVMRDFFTSSDPCDILYCAASYMWPAITFQFFRAIPYQIIQGMTPLPLRISSFLHHLQVSLKHGNSENFSFYLLVVAEIQLFENVDKIPYWIQNAPF